MAFDGIFLNAIANEIKSKATNAKVDKIYQPQKDEIILSLRCFGENIKLLLSANGSAPRLHFTALQKENPLSAPMFCMVLRKHLAGAKLVDVLQNGIERVLFLVFDCYDDFGEQVQKNLVIEIMGRHSNIILLNNENKIIDAVKHIDFSVSAHRQVLPSLPYGLPPTQKKTSILDLTKEKISEILELNKGQRLDKTILNSFVGISPLISRELSFLCTRQSDFEVGLLNEAQTDKLIFLLLKLKETIEKKEYTPFMQTGVGDNKPFEFTFMDILQYGTSALSTKFDTFSVMLDTFYGERERLQAIKQRSSDILRVLTSATERISRKLDYQKEELEDCKGKDKLKLYGDLINANIYKITKGEKSVTLQNFYEDGYPEIEIKLDDRLAPAQNAQRYYREYRKANTAEKFLTEQIEEGVKELKYLESVFDGLTKASGEAELAEIREELADSGYIKSMKKGKKIQKRTRFLEFTSSDGFLILAGRNNLQNDRLTFKTATKPDLWFHVKGYAGSHTVIIADGKTIPDSTKTEAATIAAFYSGAKNSEKVAVDYTPIKNVKKPPLAKAGMVVYDNFKTAFVTPNDAFVGKLKKEAN